MVNAAYGHRYVTNFGAGTVLKSITDRYVATPESCSSPHIKESCQPHPLSERKNRLLVEIDVAAVSTRWDHMSFTLNP